MILAGIRFLRNYPDLWKLFWANVLWTCGAGLYFFLWPNYVRDLGGGARQIGYLTGLLYGVMALSLLPSGWLADRYDHRRLMLLNWGLATLSPLLYARAHSWVELIPGVILYGLFFGWPAMESYVADTVPPKSLGRAFALTNSGYALGAVISPPLGGVLLGRLGLRGLILLAFIPFAGSTLLIGFLKPRPSQRALPAPSPKISHRSVRVWLVLLVVTGMASAGTRPFLGPFLEDVFRMPRALILTAGTALALGEFLWAWPLGHRSEGNPVRTLSTAFGLGALGAGLILVPYGFLPGLLFLGSDRVVYSLLRSLIGAQVPMGRGRLFGQSQLLATAAEALAPFATGWLYSLHPAGPLALLGGVFALCSLLLTLRGRR